MRQLRAFMVSAVLIALSSLAPQAQRGRGGDEPRPAVKEHTYDLESTFVRYPLPPDETAYGRIDGDHLKQFVNQLTAISRKDRDSGNRYWGTYPGTSADKEAHDLITSKFKEWGLQDVHLQSFDLAPQSTPTDWDLTASGGGTTLTFKTIFPTQGSAATPAEGVDLDLVWVGYGSELDFAGRDVKGKMVFIQAMPWPNGFQQTARFNGAVERAVAKGAAAVLVNVAITGNVTNSIAGPRGGIGFAIGTDDSEQLRALMEKGPVKVHARLTTQQRTGVTDANVWGSLPGTTNEEIMVIAQHDARFEGAFNNASGTATMLGLAEYFAKVPAANRRRTLRFVSVAAGGVNQIHNNRATLLANTVLIINCQNTSVVQHIQYGPPDEAKYPDQGRLDKTQTVNARSFWIYGSDKLASIAFDSLRKFGVPLWDDAMQEGGNLGAISRDVPTFQTLVTPVYFSSDHDRPDVVPPSGLEAIGRAYAKIIDQVNTVAREQIVQPAQGGK